MASNTNISVPFLQTNQQITDTTGKINPQFTNNINSMIQNVQSQLNQIMNLFSELAETNAKVDKNTDDINAFKELFKEIQKKIDFLNGYTSYTKGVSITCDTEIHISAHTRYFSDGTSIDIPEGTLSYSLPNATYYIYQDIDQTYHLTQSLDDTIQTDTRYSVGKVTTPPANGTSNGSPTLAIGQIYG